MQDKVLLPEVVVFAGPNGSGKSTITRMARTVGVYINADDIKNANLCSDLEAAEKAEELRELAVKNKENFTFETVLSTDRNLRLLKKAKDNGFFIRCIYVLTVDPEINITRIQVREASGGHGVPSSKVKLRYTRAIKLIPELVGLCDIMHIYDNTEEPFRIFKKRKDIFYRWENEHWDNETISGLTGVKNFNNS